MSILSTKQEWVKAAQAGEEAAWNILYRHYYSNLYAIALRICRDIDLAKDVVQEAFMIAYLKLNQLKDAEAFEGWLKKIVVHKCYRSVRENKVWQNFEALSLKADRWWEDELNNKFDSLAFQSKLYSLLTNLPETLRSTLLLRYFSSFQSYEEIAAVLSVPVGTVRSRLNQIKMKLSQQWNEYRDPSTDILAGAEEWNQFYYSTFSGMHRNDDCKNRFINHLQKQVEIILPDGERNTGRAVFESIIADDRKSGSWLTPASVMSCGNTSIVETTHFNSAEHPHHCPPRSVLVLYRNGGVVDKMNMHLSWK